MYKGTDLPKNYNDLSLAQKEAIWIGTLLVYEVPAYFDVNYWSDIIVTTSETVLFEDEEICFCKSYNSEYLLRYKKSEYEIMGCFDYFFDTGREDCEMLYRLGDKYKGMTVRDYIRSKGFPITSEFWL